MQEGYWTIKTFRNNSKSTKILQKQYTAVYQIQWKLCLVKWEKGIENSKDCPPSLRYPDYMGKRDCNIISFGTWRSAVKVGSWLGRLPASFLAFGMTRLWIRSTLQPVANMLRHSHEKTTFLASNRSWSQVCEVQYWPPSHSKLFVQVLSMVLYC